MNLKKAKRLRREAKAAHLAAFDPNKAPTVDSVFKIRTYPTKPGRSTISYRPEGSARGRYKELKRAEHA